ncbi:chromatin modification- protein VID21 [Maudiozyma exigua]|uniref:Chromatin modification-related protein EAF1 n=1 Tax=Maudiozyma exigua TaxID=34358 RepID=A0A9P6W4M8_MAUEX|nr:chromatin modification- protein VID21 [Kazachstania exigua]
MTTKNSEVSQPLTDGANTNASTLNNLRSRSSTTSRKGSSKGHVDRVIQLRNSKIIELYCVSRLSDLLNIKDSAVLKTDINECLSKNDITKKNNKFHIESLPKIAYFNYPNSSNIITSSYPRKSLSTGNITKKNNKSNEKRPSIALAVASSTTSSPTPTITHPQGIADKVETHSDLINYPKTNEEPTNKVNDLSSPPESSIKRKLPEAAEDNVSTPIPKKIKKVSIDEPKKTENENKIKENNPPVVSPVVAAAIEAAKQARNNYYNNLYIPPSKPTPVETKTPYANENSVVKQIKTKQPISSDFYNSKDSNAKDHVYLIAKEQIPSRIANSIPLAELKYMAQTLPLINLIPRAHKVLTTEIINNALNEARITVVGSRIEELRRLSLWGLRQPNLFIDPWNNDHTHRTLLLEEAKWMQADFKEGKNYRIATCVTVAQAVMDYWTYGKVCCIKRKPIVYLPEIPTIEESTNVTNKNSEAENKVEDDIVNAIPTNTTDDSSNNANDNTAEKVADKNDTDIVVIKVADDHKVENATDLFDEKSTVDTDMMADPTSETQQADNSKIKDVDVDMDDVVETLPEATLGKPDKTTDRNDTIQTNVIKEYSVHSSDNNTCQKIDDDHNAILRDDSTSKSENERTKTIDPAVLLGTYDSVPPVLTDNSSKVRQDDAVKLRPKEMNPFKLYISLDELSTAERNLTKEIPLYMGLDKENEKSNRKDTPFVPISKSMVTLDDDHFYKLIEKQVMDDEQSLNQLSKRRGMFYGTRRNHYLRPPAVPSLRYLRNRTPTIWLPEDDLELVKNINAYSYNWELISSQMIHRPTRSYLSNIEIRTPWQCFERFVQLNERFTFNDMKGPRAHSAQQWLIEAHKFQQRQNRRISPLGVGEESIQRGHKRLRWASMFEVMRKTIKKRENAPKPNKSQPRKPLDMKNMKIPTPAEMSQLKAQRDEALRRDVQFRRNVKNRTQQKQLLAAQQAQVQRGKATAKRNNKTSGNDPKIDQTTGKDPTNSSVPAAIPPIDKNNPEMIIILNYTKKILAQNPELPPGIAWKTAENYVRRVKEQQLKQQQQLQQQQQQIQQMQMQQGNATGQAQMQQPVQQQIQQSIQQPMQQFPPQVSQQPPAGVQLLQPQMQSPNNLSNSSLQQNLSSSPMQQGHLQPPNGNGSNGNFGNKIKSPTPSEILQRFQK